WIVVGVRAVAIGGFDDDVVCVQYIFRSIHDRVAVAAEIAGEYDAGSADVDLRGGGAENVSGPAQRQPGASGQARFLVKGNIDEFRQHALRIDDTVQGQRRLVFRRAFAVGVFRILFLQPGAVEQNELGDVVGGGSGVDLAFEAFQQQPGQIAAVIEVGMGQHDGIDAFRRHG